MYFMDLLETNIFHIFSLWYGTVFKNERCENAWIRVQIGGPDPNLNWDKFQDPDPNTMYRYPVLGPTALSIIVPNDTAKGRKSLPLLQRGWMLRNGSRRRRGFLEWRGQPPGWSPGHPASHWGEQQITHISQLLAGISSQRQTHFECGEASLQSGHQVSLLYTGETDNIWVSC